MGKEAWIAVAVISMFVIFGLFFWLVAARNRGKQRSKWSLKWFGASAAAEASNEVTPAIKIDDATSRSGSILATDGTGRGAHGSKLNADGDIVFTSKSAPQAPKA